ncbi:hypothetical protein [Fulvimonas soli]|jgi:hypothetical protein|uniref:Lipoprotein n=1 Tax=Fulvimonas soli TaxID=155197 RepID=A0A316I4F1_9GAMM|nr:hypothetical protein [Fulvimonas soli]PWK85304.1 hypothetical protein C7456_10978 [Fulvimonas soli]
MKFETVMLHSLFAACLLACALALGSMIRAQPSGAPVAGAPAGVVASRA